MQEEITFFDLFGGIGGFRHGLTQADDRFECVGYADKNKHAVKSYNRIFGEQHEPTDITEVEPEQLPDFDVLCGGFPCQAFSIAGHREGFEDTRGTLFFEIARLAEAKEPKVLLLENVKGLLSHDNGETFRVILESLDELGYNVEWQVLNSKFHGVPQNRERVFIIGYLGGRPRREVFPFRGEERGDSGEDEGEVTMLTDGSGVSHTVTKNYLKGATPQRFVSDKGQRTHVLVDDSFDAMDGELRTYEEVTPSQRSQRHNLKVIDWHGHKDKAPVLRDNSPTLRSESHGHQPKVINQQMRPEDRPSIEEKGTKIRKLTPKECWRLQGFPDESFEKAQEVNSDTQLYKQAGNAVTVNVVRDIGKRLANRYFGENHD